MGAACATVLPGASRATCAGGASGERPPRSSARTRPPRRRRISSAGFHADDIRNYRTPGRPRGGGGSDAPGSIGLGGREGEPHRGPLPARARHRDLASVRQDQAFAMARPRPAPRESGAFANRSNTWSSSSGGIPRPVSETVNATATPRTEARPPRPIPARGMSQGVREQVGQDLDDPQAIDRDRRQPVRYAALDRDAGVGGRASGSRRQPRRRASRSTNSRCNRSAPASAVESV